MLLCYLSLSASRISFTPQNRVPVLEAGSHRRHSITANGRMGFAATQQFACTSGSLSVVAMLAVQRHRNASREQ
jgi:hypothetical protein